MLLDDIVELATNDKQSIGVLLRKCVVLGHQVRNDRLKGWANKELNGYQFSDELPDYRVAPGPAKGHFSGPWGAEYKNFPIPSLVLEKEHRHFATEVRLLQAISVYEDLIRTAKPEGTISTPWPHDLVLYYQQRIPNSKGMVLISAYQEIPKGTLVELVETVRNRVLNMGLDIQSGLGGSDKDLEHITPRTFQLIDQTVIQQIFGGNVYVSTGQSTLQIQQQSISPGDWTLLERTLRNSGLQESDLAELSDALQHDEKKMGSGVLNWIKKTAPKVISGGVKIGTAVGQTLLTEYLKQYCGLK